MKIKKTIFAGLLAILALTACNAASSKGKAMEELKGKEGVFAILETEKGTVVINLFYKECPLTVSNFVGLAEGTLDAANGKKYYNGLKFHRVISKANGDAQDFMIQGGDPLGNGTGGPGYKFADEFVEGLVFDKPGLLAMANSGTNTNGSQFFITIVPTPHLDYKHTIFGEVISGQEVVNTVHQNDTIKSLTIVRQGADAEAFKVTQAGFDKLKEEGKKKAAEFQKQLDLIKEKKMLPQIEKKIQGFTRTDDGIYYKILKQGSGAVCGKGKTVTVEYKLELPTGEILDASQEFDPKRHEAISFRTGGGEVIPGWDIMVSEMKYGETRIFMIPPKMGYGDMAPYYGLPSDTYLIFTARLVK